MTDRAPSTPISVMTALGGLRRELAYVHATSPDIESWLAAVEKSARAAIRKTILDGRERR